MGNSPVGNVVINDGRYDTLPPLPWRVRKMDEDMGVVVTGEDGAYVTYCANEVVGRFIVEASRRLTVVTEREAALLQFMSAPIPADSIPCKDERP